MPNTVFSDKIFFDNTVVWHYYLLPHTNIPPYCCLSKIETNTYSRISLFIFFSFIGKWRIFCALLFASYLRFFFFFCLITADDQYIYHIVFSPVIYDNFFFYLKVSHIFCSIEFCLLRLISFYLIRNCDRPVLPVSRKWKY